MIRHRPQGRGHPYQPDDEQRLPLLPVAGQPVEIRATSHPELTDAVLEFGEREQVPMVDRGYDRSGRRRGVGTLNPLAPGELRYRIAADDGSTRTR